MKKVVIGSLTLCLSLLAGCGSDSTPSVDLYRVADVTIDSLGAIDRRMDIPDEETVLKEFSGEFKNQLNTNTPLVHPNGTVGVDTREDGSFIGFNDKDGNNVQDSGETDLFMVEIDTENQRIIASKDGTIATAGFSGLLAGAMMGMLMGNLLNRQRAAGSNPAQKQANTTRAAKNSKSRAGSGSHSRGK